MSRRKLESAVAREFGDSIVSPDAGRASLRCRTSIAYQDDQVAWPVIGHRRPGAEASMPARVPSACRSVISLPIAAADRPSVMPAISLVGVIEPVRPYRPRCVSRLPPGARPSDQPGSRACRDVVDSSRQAVKRRRRRSTIAGVSVSIRCRRLTVRLESRRIEHVDGRGFIAADDEIVGRQVRHVDADELDRAVRQIDGVAPDARVASISRKP